MASKSVIVQEKNNSKDDFDKWKKISKQAKEAFKDPAFKKLAKNFYRKHTQ